MKKWKHLRSRNLLEEQAASEVKVAASAITSATARQGCGEEAWWRRRFLPECDAIGHAKVRQSSRQRPAFAIWRSWRRIQQLRRAIHICQGGLHSLTSLHTKSTRFRKTANKERATVIHDHRKRLPAE